MADKDALVVAPANTDLTDASEPGWVSDEDRKQASIEKLTILQNNDPVVESLNNMMVREVEELSDFYGRDISGWSKLTTGGASSLEPTPNSDANREKVLKQCYYLYYRSPLARNIIRTYSYLTVGKGMTVTFRGRGASKAQTRWETISRLNRWERKYRDIITMTYLLGEWFIVRLPLQEDKAWDKKMDRSDRDKLLSVVQKVAPEDIVLCSVSPLEMRELIMSDKNRERVRQYEVTDEEIRTKTVGSASEKWPKIFWADDVEHYAIDNMGTGQRGRPILEPVLRQISYYNLFETDRVMQNSIRARIPILRQTPGGPAAKAAKKTAMEAMKLPHPGTVLIVGKEETWSTVNYPLDGASTSRDGRAILLQVCAGVSMPEYLITSDSSNANYGCHDDNTEILTPNGVWKRWDEISDNEVVGTINPQTRQLEYQKITAKIASYYTGDMVQIKGHHNLDMLVTPNHRMYVAKNQTGPYSFIRADALVNAVAPFDALTSATVDAHSTYDSTFTLPKVDWHPCGGTDGSGGNVVQMDAWLKFLGYFVSEGWTHGHKTANEYSPYTVGLSQKTGRWQEADIQRCISQLPFNFGRYVGADGMARWTAANKALWTWLRENAGADSYSKRIPAFVFSLPPKAQQIVLDALVAGDGHVTPHGSSYYYTVSETLRDQVMALAVTCGYVSGAQKQMNNGVFPVKLRLPRRGRISHEHVSAVPYSGVVWCVQVPNGIIVTRRNGKIAMHGNSSLIASSPLVSMIADYRMRFAEQFTDAIEEVSGARPEIEWPQIVQDDLLKVVQANSILYRDGAMSKHTYSARVGLRYDDEKEMRDEERDDALEAMAQMQAVPGGENPANQTALSPGDKALVPGKLDQDKKWATDPTGATLPRKPSNAGTTPPTETGNVASVQGEPQPNVSEDLLSFESIYKQLDDMRALLERLLKEKKDEQSEGQAEQKPEGQPS